MGKIVISSNVTVDGISEDPTGDEGFAFGGWFEQLDPGDREAWAKVEYEEALASSALLLGGRSYDWFAERWVARPGGWGERLTALPKYVVRSRPGRSDWGPTTVLSGDLIRSLSELRATVEGDIVVYASYQLIRTLMDNDLVDEVRLFVFPHIVGSGGRVFHNLTSSQPMRLADVNRVGQELVQLVYQPVRV
jgi:dihydrofolate reductase